MLSPTTHLRVCCQSANIYGHHILSVIRYSTIKTSGCLFFPAALWKKQSVCAECKIMHSVTDIKVMHTTYSGQLRSMSCTVAYIWSPVPPQYHRDHWYLLIWYDLADKFNIWHEAKHSLKRRGGWLTLRDALCPVTLGCRLRVRVSEMRLNPGNEYGKPALCRWHQATPSTRKEVSILQSEAQNSSPLTDWPCAMSHRGPTDGCSLWALY